MTKDQDAQTETKAKRLRSSTNTHDWHQTLDSGSDVPSFLTFRKHLTVCLIALLLQN